MQTPGSSELMLHDYSICCRDIMSVVHDAEPRGRFLRKNKTSNEWDILSEKAALEKICQVSD